MSLPHRFPHQRLDAFHLAMRARRETLTLLDPLPRGFAEDRNQLKRSSQAVPKLVAEGADRIRPGMKRRRFEEALGEIGETAAGIEDLVHLGALTDADAESAHAL